MARIKRMVVIAVFMVASVVVKANQCSCGGECPGGNKPNNVVSMLQTKLQMNALKEEGGEDSPNSLYKKVPERSPKSAKTKSGPAKMKQSTGKSRIEQLNPAACVEAVLIEPRRIPGMARAAESALRSNEIDLLTLAHGSLNTDYVQDLVAQSSALTAAWQSQRLRYLDLHVTDLGSDAVGSSHKTKAQAAHMSALQTDAKAGHADGVGWRQSYSRLLKRVSFWSQFQCDHVLIMQSDTLFCSGSTVRLSEFFGYDYVGGRSLKSDRPGSQPWSMMMNGGFSFRSRPRALACLALAKNHPWWHRFPLKRDEKMAGITWDGLVADEDFFFTFCPLLKRPPARMAERFAVDNGGTLASEVPLGVHKPWIGEYSTQTMQMCSGALELSHEQNEAEV